MNQCSQHERSTYSPFEQMLVSVSFLTKAYFALKKMLTSSLQLQFLVLSALVSPRRRQLCEEALH